MRYSPLRITVFYILISLLWIALSDKLLFLLHNQLSFSLFEAINMIKGLVFVAITGLLLFRLISANNKSLLNGEQHYRLIYENNRNPMWVFDRETLQFLSVNKAAIKDYGYNEKEFLNMTVFDLRPTEDAPLLNQVLKSAGQQESYFGRWRHLKKDGSLLYVDINAHHITFNNRPAVLVVAANVTETVSYEQKLQQVNRDLEEQKRKLSETQLTAKVAGWEYYPESEKLVWSDELYLITQIKPDNRDPLHLYSEHVIEEDRPIMHQALEALIYEGKKMDIIQRIRLDNGDVRFMRQLGKVEQQEGHPIKVTGSMQDITELKKLEMECNRYLMSFEETLNNISDAFFAVNDKMVITRTNKNFEIYTGINSVDAIGKDYFDVFPNALDGPFYEYYKKVMREGIAGRLEGYSAAIKRWLSLAAYPTNEGVAICFSDVTEEKEKDLRLKEALKRYDLVAQATNDVIYEFDIRSNYIEYNTSLAQLVNLPAEKIEPSVEWWRSLIHPEDREHVIQTQKSVLENGEHNWSCEYRIMDGLGGYKYVLEQGHFLFDENDQAIRLIGAIKDIDLLKRVDEENRQLAKIITHVNNMITVIDLEGKITWVNKAFEDHTGYSFQEIKGRSPGEFLTGPESDKEVLKLIGEKKKRQETFEADLLHYTKYGDKQWVNIEFTPIFSECKQHTGYIAVHQNITARKEKEEEIKKQNEILREIAWLSSHEVRRPVASIMGLTGLIHTTRDVKEKEELMALVNECACQLDEIVHRISNTTEHLIDN